MEKLNYEKMMLKKAEFMEAKLPKAEMGKLNAGEKLDYKPVK